MEISKRYAHIDLAAGIMILWMIIYHALGYTWGFNLRDYWHITDLSMLPEGARAFINEDGKLEAINVLVVYPYLCFFMPWFFYKSGQFFKTRPFDEHLRKDSSKLLLTFIIWSAIGYVFYLVFGTLQHSLTLRGSTYSIVRGLFLTGKVPINEPLWFLLTLFGVRFVANWLLPNKDNKYRWPIVACIIIAGYIIAYACFCRNHRLLPYWVSNGASGLVFFSLGYALRDYENKWWLIAPCVVVYLTCCFIGFPMVDMLFNRLVAGNYLLWMPVAFCGIITFNVFCRVLCKHIRIKLLELAGQNAMTIYVTHILILLTCTFIVEYFELANLYPHMLWIILGSYAAFLPLFCMVSNLKHKKKA